MARSWGQAFGGGSVFNSFKSEKIVLRPISVLISLHASFINGNRFCEHCQSVSQSIFFSDRLDCARDEDTSLLVYHLTFFSCGDLT